MAARIRHQVYGPLRPHPGLAQTLDALIAHDFNRQRAAAALPVHRNTFRDRLTRIGELTGLDLERTEDRGLAWLAHLCAPDPHLGNAPPG
jgi:DNA-binding PucR family transcriptional regulator